MRRFIKLALTCLAAGAVGACEVDTVIETEAIPTAGVRFINAVPDTGAMDFRFIDMVENTSHWNTGYRNNPSTTALETNSLQVQYKNARAGSRTYKIFMTGITPAIASDEVLPAATTVTLNAGSNYTVLLWGYANPTGPGRPAGAPAMSVQLIDENVTVPTGNVALRVINASTNAVTASFYTNPAAATSGTTVTTVPARTAIQSNLAAMTVGTYFNLATPATLRWTLEPPGGPAGQFWANQVAMIGQGPTVGGAACTPPTVCDIEGSPGTTQAGSAITAIVWPTAVTPASNTGMTITTGNTPQRVTFDGDYAAPRDYFTDGFFIGQEITVSGFTNAANNGAAQITAIRARPTSGSNNQFSATATGYARSTGSFITNGFAVGDEITASGFTTTANNGRSTITAVTATALTVTKTGGTTAEAACNVTTTPGCTARSLIGDGEITVNKVLVTEAFPTTNRTIAGTRGRLMSFIWDRRPPRPAGT
jgi:hypothetical protein